MNPKSAPIILCPPARTLADQQQSGGLQELNREFKAARSGDGRALRGFSVRKEDTDAAAGLIPHRRPPVQLLRTLDGGPVRALRDRG
jgi:hypothetical protein